MELIDKFDIYEFEDKMTFSVMPETGEAREMKKKVLPQWLYPATAQQHQWHDVQEHASHMQIASSSQNSTAHKLPLAALSVLLVPQRGRWR